MENAGTVSKDKALAWANDQYDAFAERRRLAAEIEAERRYLDDLRNSAERLETERTAQRKEEVHKRVRRPRGKP